MSANDGGAAFPCEEVVTVTQMQVGNDSPFPIEPYKKTIRHPGMTLRDWFAGQALAGVCAMDTENRLDAKTKASWSYELSEAMLKHRARIAEDAAHKEK